VIAILRSTGHDLEKL